MEPRSWVKHSIQTPHGKVSVTEYLGRGTTVVLLHGFFDDSRMYKKLVPALRDNRVLAIDFLGYGDSEQRTPQRYSTRDRVLEVAAVLTALLDGRSAVIVGHCGGGPVAVQYALANPELVERLVLLNTYFGDSPTLRLPETLRLLADAKLGSLSRAIFDNVATRQWLVDFTARQFGYYVDENAANTSGVPGAPDSHDEPIGLPAVRGWASTLFADMKLQNELIDSRELTALAVPTCVAFGMDDRYFNSGVAEFLAAAFTNSRVHAIEGASHWPQWEQPEIVARLIVRD